MSFQPDIYPLLSSQNGEDYGTIQQKLDLLESALHSAFEILRGLRDELGRQSSTIDGGNGSPFEFYRIASGWVIRWDGELVDLGGKHPEKGLLYIHRLLCQSGERLNLFQFEGVTEVDDGVTVQIHDSVIVNMDKKSFLGKLIPASEAEIFDSLARLRKEKPTHNSSLEQEIFFYSQVYYLTDLLCGISKSSHFEKRQQTERLLNDLITRLRTECDDADEIQRIITQSKTIRRVEDYNQQRTKMRDRISKNISNAINQMNIPPLQQYLRKHIQKGIESCYNPPPRESVEWKLFID